MSMKCGEFHGLCPERLYRTVSARRWTSSLTWLSTW
uniref:Uncharacterized protein n=1 Tax=Anguilla anguilla TaxID=7936 RepID=A0A0E9U177_ANGAN